MNKFIQASCRSLTIALIGTLILTASPLVIIEHANAREVYAEQADEFSEAELAQILAPIALYPDSLLTHILIASTYPLEIVQANRWRIENSHLNANQAMKKAEKKNWDPSVIALVAFPNVLDRLSDDLVWTQKLGDAFLQDEAKLLACIQLLRQQADQVDSLSAMENMSVTRVDDQIIIEPVQKEIIYVPYYDSRVVYGHWHWYSYPPVYWKPYPYYIRRPYALFYWGSGIHITFNYYFSTFNWHKHHIVVVNHHNSHYYRHRVRIINSHGAQRWNHRPYHRRGVAYRSQDVKQRYNLRPPRRIGANQIQNKLREQRTEVKKNDRRENNGNKLPAANKQRFQSHKQPFVNKSEQQQQTKSYRRSQNEVKSHKQLEIHPMDKPLQIERQREEKKQQPIKSHKGIKSYQPEQTKSYHRSRSEVKGQKQPEIYQMQQNGHKPRQKKSLNDK